jgi:hypothetical protein
VRRPSNALPSRFGISLVVPSGSQVGWPTHSFHIPRSDRGSRVILTFIFDYRWI